MRCHKKKSKSPYRVSHFMQSKDVMKLIFRYCPRDYLPQARDAAENILNLEDWTPDHLMTCFEHNVGVERAYMLNALQGVSRSIAKTVSENYHP